MLKDDSSNMKLNHVFEFAIDDELLVERINGRWVHPASGRIYHTKFAPPRVSGKDDVRLFTSFAINALIDKYTTNWKYVIDYWRTFGTAP